MASRLLPGMASVLRACVSRVSGGLGRALGGLGQHAVADLVRPAHNRLSTSPAHFSSHSGSPAHFSSHSGSPAHFSSHSGSPAHFSSHSGSSALAFLRGPSFHGTAPYRAGVARGTQSGGLLTLSCSAGPRPVLPPGLPGARQYHVRVALKRRCTSCFFVRRKGRLFVECKAKPRHKQMQVMSKRKVWKEDYSEGNIRKATFRHLKENTYYKIGDNHFARYNWLKGKIGVTV